MNAVTFPAGQARVTGALKILDTPVEHTIHYWNNLEDSISWIWPDASPGNYLVTINYSLNKTLVGGVFSLRAGEQQITVTAPVTESWYDFKTFEMGILQLEEAGTLPIVLQALKLPEAKETAMPDITWLKFIPV
ncbi:MAG: Xylose isomerase-like barrel [Sphingobacteriales bacterium]|nr:Xylose isomerase-like barrel [Sphingobacteriales bacterium]